MGLKTSNWKNKLAVTPAMLENDVLNIYYMQRQSDQWQAPSRALVRGMSQIWECEQRLLQ